jgi:hypothetical protein
VLRALKAAVFDPTHIRAVMFMNEENGGRGGDKYLELAKLNKEKHVFALEVMAGGLRHVVFSLDMTKEKRNKIEQWKNLFYGYGVYEFSAGGSGSDIDPLKANWGCFGRSYARQPALL